MPTTPVKPVRDQHPLNAAERDWIRRQGHAATSLEKRQRRAAHAAARHAAESARARSAPPR
jgi:hypothetical protein